MLAPATANVEEALLALIAERGIVSEQTIARARRAAAGSSERVDQALVKLGLLDEGDYVNSWAELLTLERVEAAAFPQEPVLPELLRGRFLRDAEILPLADDDNTLVVAVVDPLNAYGLKALRWRA